MTKMIDIRAGFIPLAVSLHYYFRSFRSSRVSIRSSLISTSWLIRALLAGTGVTRLAQARDAPTIKPSSGLARQTIQIFRPFSIERSGVLTLETRSE